MSDKPEKSNKKPLIEKKSRITSDPLKPGVSDDPLSRFNSDTQLSELKMKDILDIIDASVELALTQFQSKTSPIPGTNAAHANSGPTGHENVPGHANFKGSGYIPVPEAAKPEWNKPEVYKPEGPKPEWNKPEGYKPEWNKPETYKPEGSKPEWNKSDGYTTPAAHVNSGPTGHENVPGHANFKSQTNSIGEQLPFTLTLANGAVITLGPGAPKEITIGNFKIIRSD